MGANKDGGLVRWIGRRRGGKGIEGLWGCRKETWTCVGGERRGSSKLSPTQIRILGYMLSRVSVLRDPWNRSGS